MFEENFRREMLYAKGMERAEPERLEYWRGYQRGMRRNFHGSIFGTQEEHVLWLSMSTSDEPRRQQRGLGYCDGFEKNIP